MKKEIQGLEDRYRGIDSYFSWIEKMRLEMVGCYLYSCWETEDLSYGLIKRLRILFSLIIFRSLRLILGFISFCGQVYMIYDSP